MIEIKNEIENNNENQENSIMTNQSVNVGVINDSRSSSQQINLSSNNIDQPLINNINNIQSYQNINQIHFNNLYSDYPPQKSFNVPRPFSNNERNRYYNRQNYNIFPQNGQQNLINVDNNIINNQNNNGPNNIINNQNNNGPNNNSQRNYQVQLPPQYNNSNPSHNLKKFNRTFILRNFGISCGTFIVCLFIASCFMYIIYRANFYIYY